MHGEPLLAWPAADDRNAAESCHEFNAFWQAAASIEP
jgi:hypothetical protein